MKSFYIVSFVASFEKYMAPTMKVHAPYRSFNCWKVIVMDTYLFLVQVAGGSVNREVTYPYFKAFNQFLGNLNILEKVVQGAVSSSHDTKATQGEREGRDHRLVERSQLGWSQNRETT